MSPQLMDTEAGGEQTQYEAEATHVQPHKKSGGQLGDVATTTDPTKTEAHAQEHSESGARKAENMRYGQALSEEGMGGTTVGQEGSAQQGGGRRTGDSGAEPDDAQARSASGYGGEKDMDRSVGA